MHRAAYSTNGHQCTLCTRAKSGQSTADYAAKPTGGEVSGTAPAHAPDEVAYPVVLLCGFLLPELLVVTCHVFPHAANYALNLPTQ